MITGLFGAAITMGVMFYVGTKVKKGKYNRFVGLVQWVFEGLLRQIEDIIPDRKLGRKIIPLAVTIFFLILINYWLSVLPGLDTVKIGGVPLLRSPTSDLNFVLGLAFVTVISIQIYAIKHLGILGNVGRYLRNPFRNPIGAFEGILEIIGEVSRGGSLALRLFGNAFAGEILLVVITLLTSYLSVVALPIFMVFEMLIGFIQAYVFFVLTLIFTALAVSHHEEPAQSEHSTVVTSNMTVQPE
ncbi:ATP synthase subunit A [Candidatus Saccharibacteria bacterium CG11_big_fil_rev_8_21_14_0_20_41_19]|nr:MAG: ATP synthase subunit A [Candidatus Saccharibacteria bacterium CG2_30_41_52]PIQ70958.1 MAG: ATP synthase subunit A [Candidatus Saccharibacteria bacterium CG11_big_fil_rev_8_21_14_0_20_41_19]PIZ60755.1 MAG: ATP synthase subunit A [Candidatus Saccharibacteria bacterium CG_4_10_14_0_2_um_filter_41_11]PJC29410.1 MAG: ATP synthase subunit A [Candidatus Saccharibacteria bacterium CG_4_9_14_0_2_um_filter_41_9]PJE65883.1 MAG: ATP synthase subunit A [Candidatus Saccharibacteria bacterium CG10_big